MRTPKALILRPRQKETITLMRAGIKAGLDRPILMGATGSGKTAIATEIIKLAVAKGSRCLFLCDRIPLIEQASHTFDTYGIAHGIIQANHWRKRAYEKVQIGSIQTLARREIEFNFDLVLVDECHSTYDYVTNLIKSHPKTIFIGLSATPFTKGLGQIYTNVINAMPNDDLLDEGWLVPPVCYIGRRASTEGVSLDSAGEWNKAQISERNGELIGDVCSAWVDKCYHHFGGPVKTILFSATKADGEVMRNKFIDQGYNFVQVTDKTPKDEFIEIVKEFAKKDSKIIGLISVAKLAKGFDNPLVKCIIDCRPLRKALSEYLQILGRGGRPVYSGDPNDATPEERKRMMAEAGKPFFLVMDHSGNWDRFREDRERIYAEGLNTLDGRSLDESARKDPDEKEDKTIYCASCGEILDAYYDVCPLCGGKTRKPQSLMIHEPGVMVLAEPTKKPKGPPPLLNATNKKEMPPWMADKAFVWRQFCAIWLQRKRGDKTAAERGAQAQYKWFYGRSYTGPFDPAEEIFDKAVAQHKYAMVTHFNSQSKKETA